MSLLRVEGIRKSFGGVDALDGTTFEVQGGSITGLIGPNGAGKTTLFDVATGFQSPDAGTVHFDGRRVDNLAPHQITKAGMARTFQLVRLLPRLSALENLLVAEHHAGETLTGALFGGWRKDEAAARRRAMDWLEFVGMTARADVPGGNLSYGQSKLVEFARTLMLDPRLVLLDEPMAGINPTLRRRLLDRIHTLREEQGKTFLLIEHDIEMIMEHCDQIIVMDQGRVIAAGPPDQVRDNPRVGAAYLGSARAQGAAGGKADG